jgi:CRISPR-associated protein (TIGR03984 family)
MQKINNGLIPGKIKSRITTNLRAESITDIKKLCPETYDIAAYLDNEVLIGKLTGGKFHFYKTIDDTIFPFIQKIRIFNQNEEILLWRKGKTLTGRKRADGSGDEINVIFAEQLLYGTVKESMGDGFCRLSEERGTEIILPDRNYTVDNGVNRLSVNTINYIGYNNGVATYTDCRFVEFSQFKGGK